MKQPGIEEVASWAMFRALESLEKGDVPMAQSFLVDGVNWLIHGTIPERYAFTEAGIKR